MGLYLGLIPRQWPSPMVGLHRDSIMIIMYHEPFVMAFEMVLSG